MLRSYEAEVGQDGTIRLREPMVLRCRHRAVVTVLEPMESDDDVIVRPTNGTQDWRRFVGILKGSPHFKDDPVSIQKAMRDEWD